MLDFSKNGCTKMADFSEMADPRWQTFQNWLIQDGGWQDFNPYIQFELTDPPRWPTF